MKSIVPTTPRYGPTGVIVLNLSGAEPRGLEWSSVVGKRVFIRVLVAWMEWEWERTAIWPRLRTVSRGSLRKSSARERRKCEIEEMVGVCVGSMCSGEERRSNGVLVDSSDGSVL